MTNYTCSQCYVEKASSEFYVDRRNTVKGITSRCKECAKANQRERNKSRVYTSADRERKRTWEQLNREKVNARAREKRKENPKMFSETYKRWYVKSAGVKARYRRGIRIAVPKFAEKEKIKQLYRKAREWGLEVDHIVPIQHPLVCGLHSWSNLQLLDKSLNSSKQNRYWPDMPSQLSSSELRAITA